MFTAIHWVDHLKEITKVITHIRKSNLIYITCGNYFRDLVDFLTTIYISDYIFFWYLIEHYKVAQSKKIIIITQ